MSFPQFIILEVISPFTYGKQLHVRQIEMSRLTAISIAMVHAFHSLQPLCMVFSLMSEISQTLVFSKKWVSTWEIGCPLTICGKIEQFFAVVRMAHCVVIKNWNFTSAHNSKHKLEAIDSELVETYKQLNDVSRAFSYSGPPLKKKHGRHQRRNNQMTS